VIESRGVVLAYFWCHCVSWVFLSVCLNHCGRIAPALVQGSSPMGRGVPERAAWEVI